MVLFKEQPEAARALWQALNMIPSSEMVREGRVYGGGLNKMEPRELEKVPLDELASRFPYPLSAVGADQYTQLSLLENQST